MQYGSKFTIFVIDNKSNHFLKLFDLMKYNEMHRIIRRFGWEAVRQSGSHVIYERDEKRYPVPNHGAKEVPEGLRKRIFRDMGLE